MLLKVFRFGRGYVRFTAAGKFPERFINAAAANKLNLWDAYPAKDSINGVMAATDYKRARHIAKRAGVKLKITKKRGLPFIFKKHINRIGLPIGAALGAVILIVLSQFIWTVEIVGANSVSEYRIRQVLAENGVYPGGFKGSIDVLKAQRAVQFKIDELSWVSINNLGCNSTVDVREKAQKSDPPPGDIPCNIKAKCDGVITSINAQNGLSAVEIGSGVAAGDLLVSGVMPTQQNIIRFVRAEAEVYADVNSELEIKIPKHYHYYSLTENKASKNELNFLWLNLPASLNFAFYNDSVSTENRRDVTLNGVALPLGITTETVFEVGKAPAGLTLEQTQNAFDSALLINELFENPDCTVKSRKIKINDEGEYYNCRCDYVFNQNIAESVEFNVTEH